MELSEKEKLKIISALELQVSNIYTTANQIITRGDTHNEAYMAAMFESIEFNKQLIKKLKK